MDAIGQLVINSLVSGSIYALASLGLALSYGFLRILNFAHGQLMMAGAYAFLFGFSALNLGIPGAGIFAAAASAILSWILLKAFVRPFADCTPIAAFVSTLSFGIILENLIAIVFGPNSRAIDLGYLPESVDLGIGRASYLEIIIFLTAIGLFAVLRIIESRTILGVSVRAAAEAGENAEALGVDSELLSGVIFILGGLAAALAGVFVGLENSIGPSMGASYTMKAFAAIVLGGLGSARGAIVGSLVLGFAENFAIGLDLGALSLPSGYRDAFSSGFVLLLLLVKPEGFLGRRGRAI